MTARRLCVLGATGSIGGAALDVAKLRGDIVSVLVGDKNAAAMQKLCLEFRPQLAIMRDAQAAEKLHSALSAEGISVDGGEEAVRLSVGECCTVIAGIAGAGGLPPVLEAARRGRRILLANKESLAFAGELLMRIARENGAEVLPIDSEHAALFDLLEGRRGFAKLWLTASGGALRDMPESRLCDATPEQALAHPTWKMGRKITVDSATMMNKVLEIMEASVLFGAPPDKIGAVLHPQSIVHAFAEEADGVLAAQMSHPDMRRPIARMLSYPDESPFRSSRPNWKTLSSLSFSEPSLSRYPCLSLAAAAMRLGGAAAAALSAANEIAVERFLNGEIKFTDIARLNSRALEKCAHCSSPTLDDLRAADEYARVCAGGE